MTSGWPQRCISLRPENATLGDLIEPALAIDPDRVAIVFQGYWNNPEATEEAMRGGWLHTGDLGRMDEDGYIFIVGRDKDLVIVSGYNVYPSEVEAVMDI